MPIPDNEALQTPLPSRQAASNQLVEQLCTQLELRLRAGENIRSETILSEHPSLTEDPELALDLIYTEFVTRCEVGQNPEVDDFIARFPQWRTELTRQFQLAEILDNQLTRVQLGHLSEPIPPAERALPDRRFVIGSLLARGGIGQVMHAIDMELHREVAVKEIQPALAASLDIRERFLREAEITGRLEHPGIVPVYALGRDERRRPFYAMRLVRGESMHDAIQAFHLKSVGQNRFQSLEFKKLLRRFLSVCETVEYAHSRGVIHRDLKPQNILLGPFGETLIVDWGLAKVLDRSSSIATAGNEDFAFCEAAESHEEIKTQTQNKIHPAKPIANWEVDLTHQDDVLIGTPAFMSPEQAQGESHAVGPASDIYSLGATLYSLLTGQPRFGDSNVEETLFKVRLGQFPRPRENNRKVPRGLEAICLKALALKPEDRYPSSASLADDIDHWLADESVTAYPENYIAVTSRWTRRHRSSVLVGLLGLCLLTITSAMAALSINRERLRADQERIEAQRSSARLAFDRGYQLSERNEFGEAVHWYTRALVHAPTTDRDFRKVILTNLSASQHRLLHRVHLLSNSQTVSSQAYSSDGEFLLTTDNGGEVRIWNATTGVMHREMKLGLIQPTAAAYDESGSFLIATILREKARIHRLPVENTRTVPPSISIEHDAPISFVTFSPDGRFLATGSRADKENALRVWRVADGRMVTERRFPTSIERIHFHPRGSSMAVVGSDGAVRLWDWRGKSEEPKLIQTEGPIHRMAFAPNGRTLIVGTRNGLLVVWDLAKERKHYVMARESGAIVAVACSWDNDTVAAAWEIGDVCTFSLSDRQTRSEKLHVHRFTSELLFRPNASQFSSLHGQSEATVWELPDLEKTVIPLEQRTVESVAMSKDGSVAVTANRSGKARVREAQSGNPVSTTLNHSLAVLAVDIRNDASLVLTASADGTVKLWRPDGSECGILDHRSDSSTRIDVLCALFSPDGNLIATGDMYGVVRLWDTNSRQLLQRFDTEPTSGPIASLAFSPDGELLFAGHRGRGRTLHMWRTKSGERLWSNERDGMMRTVAFSSDSRLALSAGSNGAARVWNATTGELCLKPLEHQGEVFSARFSPDDRLIVTCAYDSTARLWSTVDGRAVGVPMKHQAVVLGACFNSDGKRLLTHSADKTIRLWDVATCLPLMAPMQHNDAVMNAGFHPSGELAISNRLWRFPRPLPDCPDLIPLWSELVTQRTFDSNHNPRWLTPSELETKAQKFASLTSSVEQTAFDFQLDLQRWPR